MGIKHWIYRSKFQVKFESQLSHGCCMYNYIGGYCTPVNAWRCRVSTLHGVFISPFVFLFSFVCLFAWLLLLFFFFTLSFDNHRSGVKENQDFLLKKWWMPTCKYTCRKGRQDLVRGLSLWVIMCIINATVTQLHHSCFAHRCLCFEHSACTLGCRCSCFHYDCSHYCAWRSKMHYDS